MDHDNAVGRRLLELQGLESMLRNAGAYDEALTILDQMLELDDSYSPALNNKAGILMLLDRYEEAGPLVQRAVQVNSDNGQAWNNLGMYLLYAGEPEEAEQAFRKALDCGYRHPGVMQNIARAVMAKQMQQIANHTAKNEIPKDKRPQPRFLERVLPGAASSSGFARWLKSLFGGR